MHLFSGSHNRPDGIAAKAKAPKQLVDVTPLDTLVQRRISHAVVHEQGASYGTVHRVQVDELSLEDLAVYYFERVKDKYDLEVMETYNPKDKTTTLEIRMTEPQDITDFCSFEVFAPINTAVGALRYKLGRSSNIDLIVVGVIKLRYIDNKHTPGCVTFEVDVQTCKINGATGSITGPHLNDREWLKKKPNMDKVLGHARKQARGASLTIPTHSTYTTPAPPRRCAGCRSSTSSSSAAGATSPTTSTRSCLES